MKVMKLDWTPPKHWNCIESIDAHTAGEPLRIFTNGLPDIKGESILEQRRYFKENYDHLRASCMFEPRGHADMYGAVLTEAKTADGDFGIFFIHNEGYSTMCGHAIIALSKILPEIGIIQKTGEEFQLKIDTPAGRITSTIRRKNGKFDSVKFQNVPSFVYFKDAVNHSRNVCVFAEGEVDRSPTGTGVSARAAIHYFNGDIQLNERIRIESILDTCFEVKAIEETKFGGFKSVIPEVSGTAYITGQHKFYIDPEDPLKDGFIFR